MKLTKHQLGALAVIISISIWSAAAPILKWSLAETPPFTLLFFRFLLATLIMLPIVKKKLKIKFKDFYKILLLTLLGLTFNLSFAYLGLTLAESINAPIIASSMPIFLIIGSIIFFHEIPRRKEVMGTIISLLGVLIIVVRPVDHMPLQGFIIGNMFFILSILSLVCYTLLFKKFKLSYAPSTLLFWMFLLATITTFPQFLYETRTANSLATLDFRGTFGIIYSALFSSVLGQSFYNYAVKYLKTDEIGIFTLLGPVVTALIAIPLLHEQITFPYLLGSLFVFFGLIIAEAKLHYHPFHHLVTQKDDF
ncbi:MAG TPA: DMT family transporter [Candidatus Sulfotelmatobacter sp.]|jgi:drug/metabolite transporter (DMT)-like permease|nr:DMT family transporter [Candidatus Sulfotelmatobacter sp.]